MTDLPTLREMLATQRARLKIAIGNEAKAAKITPQAGRVIREVERLTALIAEREAEEAFDVAPVSTKPVGANAGAERLIKGRWPLSRIAGDCRVSKETAKRWRQGKKTPSATARARLSEAPYRIPVDAWEHTSISHTVAPARRRASKGVDTAQELRDQIESYRDMLTEPGLSADARLKAHRGLTSALVALSHKEGTQITETVIVRHPAHQRVQAIIFTALESYPEAARAVADALKAAAG